MKCCIVVTVLFKRNFMSFVLQDCKRGKSDKKRKSKASFKVNRASKRLRGKAPPQPLSPEPAASEPEAAAGDDSESGEGAPIRSYKGIYSLDGLPEAALPQEGKENQGNHSYTLTDDSGAKIEVLLKHNAFYIKKVSSDGTGPKGQLSWAKYGGVCSAWNEALRRAGYTP